MKITNLIVSIIAASSIVCSCASNKQPQAKHVILLGFDAMSAAGVQKADTPTFDRLMEKGSYSMHMRCVRTTSSSQNWMSMVSAAPIEMHGVFGNSWKPEEVGKPDAKQSLPPTLQNKLGIFPTIFDHIRNQKPELKQIAYIEWTDEARMYDMSAFDESHVLGKDEGMKDWHDVIEQAFQTYLDKRPEFFFLSMDIPDHVGHEFGHDSQEYADMVSCMDSYVGEFISKLEKKHWMKNTVVIITADHGGKDKGHGGDSLNEFEIPVILYGKGVTKGKEMQNHPMIYDIGATAASLLGVELPWECRGKMLTEAFEK